MEPLHNRHCEPCRAGSVALDNEKARQLLDNIPGWRIEDREGIHRLVKTFGFSDFKQAFEFATQIASAAEQENHHPVIGVEWGKTSVQWWTHSIAGLHLNDFIMAAKTEQAAERQRRSESI